MLKGNQKTGRYVSIIKKLLPLLSFIIPLSVLYYLYPTSYEATWKGRTYYLFFLWLISLELILNWEQLQHDKLNKLRSARTFAFAIAITLPTIYIILANFYGLNTAIVNWATQYTPQTWGAEFMPLCIEYLTLALLFIVVNMLMYGKRGLVDFSISTSLLVAIGVIYTIDNVYPYGQFTPFQLFVPTTADLSSKLLNLMGYHTRWLGNSLNMPTIIAWDSQGHYSAPFSIAWPCSGVESLILYTVTILLFLKKTNISWIAKIIYFVIGAAVTYFINLLRIATIYIISINQGNVGMFHDFYGQLYSITWIISYPLIIIGSRLLWSRVLGRKKGTEVPPANATESSIPVS